MANIADLWRRNGKKMTPSEAGKFMQQIMVDLRDGDEPTRQAARNTLLTLKTKDTLQQLIDSLTSENAEMRQWAALLLGQMGDRQAVLPLIAHLSDPDPNVRFEIYAALGWLADRRAIYPLLVAAVQEKEPALRDVIEGVVAACTRANM